MKHLATMALMLNLGVAGIYAQPGSVNMTVSGTSAASTINLQPGTPFGEYLLSGTGTWGRFDLRALSHSVPTQQKPSTCSGSTELYLSVTAGAGVFRFADGDLLKVKLTGGSDCINFQVGQALCIRDFQITGGTGRFTNASGTVTLTMTVVPVMADGSGNPVFFAVTGGITGAPTGAVDQEPQDGRR